MRKWREECWARIFSLFREHNLQCLQKQAGGVNGRRRDEAAAKMKIVKDLTKKIRSKGRMDAEIIWCVSELLAADCEKALIH